MGVTTVALEPSWVDFGVPDGEYGPGDLGSGYVLEDRVVIRDGHAQSRFRLSGRLIWSQVYLESQVAAGTRIVIKGSSFVPYSKKTETAPLPPTSLIPRENIGDVLAGNAELRAMFGSVPFNHPKPITLIKYLVNAVAHDDNSAVILDFFAGSGSTAHAVGTLNASDGGGRRCISVNLPEPVPEGSNAKQLGYDVVSEITVARIKKAMKSDALLMTQGLRHFYLTASNFRDATTADPEDLFDLRESTLEGGDHVLEYIAQEVLLKEGVRLDAKWERHKAAAVPVIVADGVAVVMCLDLTQEVADAALALEPKVVVFLEDGFAGADAVKANAVTNAKNAGIVMKTV